MNTYYNKELAYKYIKETIIDVGENLDVSQAAEIIELDNGYVMPGLNIQEIFLS